MIKRGDKTGQFYLIAAIILIAILIGFVSLANYSKQKNPVQINNIKEELKIEGEKILDYETSSGNETMRDFFKNYSSYAGKNTYLYLIIGEEGNIKAYNYTESIEKEMSITEDENIILIIDEISYEFELKIGKNFYFIISQEINDEKYIVTN